MTWEPRNVKDQVVEFPNKFKIDGEPHTIEPDFGNIVEPGTPINRAYLQPIEDYLANEVETKEGAQAKADDVQANLDTHSADDAAHGINEKADKAPPIVAVSASKTLALSDAGTVQNCTNASAITITIPNNATVEFSTGTELAILRRGTGTVTISPANGVTMNSKDSKNGIDGQYASCALKKIDTDIWMLVGALV